MVIVNFFKRYWLFIVLAGVATLLSILWYTKPTEKEDPNLPTLTKLELPGKKIETNTRIIVNTKADLTTAPLLKIQAKLPLSPDAMQTMANTLGFEGAPTIVQDATDGPIYTWSVTGLSLTITPSKNEIRFAQDLFLLPLADSGNFMTDEEAKLKINELMTSLGLPVEKFDVGFARLDGTIPVTATQTSAQFLRITSIFSSGEYNIVSYDPNITKTEAWIDRSGTIVKFRSSSPIEPSVTPLTAYPVKNLQEIIESIQLDGKVVLIGDGSLEMPRPDALSTIEISEINLAYFLPEISKENSIHPIFILKGSSQTNFGNFPVWIYLPAIKEKYY